MNIQQRIQQRVNEIDAQVLRLAIRGVRACASIALRMRADVIRAYRNGDAPLAAMRKHYPAIAKVLIEGMSAAHGRGAVDALKVADMRVGRIKLDRQTDPYKTDIDFLKARLLLTDTEVASLARAYTAEALSVTGDIGSILDRRIGGVLSKSFSEGLHVKDGVEALRQEFDAAGITVQKPYLLETTFRTQMALAHAAGRANANADPAVQEILWGYTYTTVGDDRVRPTHAAMDGVTRPKEDPLWRTWTPPCGFNCVPRGTMITTRRGAVPIEHVIHGDEVWTHKRRWRSVIELHRNWGSGHLVEIHVDERSAPLRATGNHRVLTKRGWIEASRLQIGDYVAAHVAVTVSHQATGDVENPEQLKTVLNRAVPDRIHSKCAPGHFDSDPKIQEKVEPVSFGRCVEAVPEAVTVEDFSESTLPSAHFALGVGVFGRVNPKSGTTVGVRSVSDIGTKERGRCPEFGSGGNGSTRIEGVCDPVGVGLGAGLDPTGGEHPLEATEHHARLGADVGHGAPSSDVVGEHPIDPTGPRSVNPADGFSQVRHAPIRLVSHDTIVDVSWGKITRISSVTTHDYAVFNLGIDEDESYFANGVCVHNCRCTLVEVFNDDPAEMKTGPKPPTRILVDGAEVEVKPDAGWDFNPGDVYGDILNITAPVGGGAYRGVHV